MVKASSIFLYFVIALIAIVYFRSINVELNVVLGLTLAFILIFVLYKLETSNKENMELLHQTKAENIYPPTTNIKKYGDLTDFIFSIQDFYIYNPQAFEDMVKATDTFLEIYEEVLIDPSLAGRHYDNANAQKLLALNHLHSIIIMIPSSKLLIEKLNASLQQFEELLNNYLTVIYDTNTDYIKKYGYFNNSKVIDLKVSPFDDTFVETDGKYY